MNNKEPDKEPDEETEDSFRAVKMTLNQFCSNTLLKKRINEFVLNANKIMFEAYSLANLHIIKLINQRKKIPILNQTFFQHCCQAVSFSYKRKNNMADDLELQDTFSLYVTSRPLNYQPGFKDYNGPVINYIGKDMDISTTNHLVLNFYSKLTKYIKNKYNLSGEQTYKLIKEIYEVTYTGNNIIIQKWRDKLNNLPPTAKNVKKDPSYIIYAYNDILNYFNTRNLDTSKKAIRIFSILPNKNSFTISNITICKNVLKDIIITFQDEIVEDKAITYICNQKAYKRSTDIKNNPKKHWNQFFNIKNIDSFAGMIKTDGNSVSVLYKKERLIISRTKKNMKGVPRDKNRDYNVSNINLEDFDIIKTVDPGFKNLYMGTNTEEKKDMDITKSTSKNYYHDCKINKASQQKKIIYKKNTFITSFFKNMPSNKTNNINLYLEYISYSLSGLTTCLKFHFDKPFRKLKFTTFIYKQKTMINLCKKLTEKSSINDTKKVLIGFGDWSSQKDSIIRGHRRGPIVKLKNELKRWCTIKLVDEYNTSKLCCKCESETEKVSYNNVKINSVLRCRNNECGMVIDRDINGCKNIFKIFKYALEGKERPKAYCRPKILPKKKTRKTVKVGIIAK